MPQLPSSLDSLLAAPSAEPASTERLFDDEYRMKEASKEELSELLLKVNGTIKADADSDADRQSGLRMRSEVGLAPRRGSGTVAVLISRCTFLAIVGSLRFI
jgi:hypothetical protein